MLNCSGNNTYYLHDYYQKKRFPFISGEAEKIRESIFRYKDSYVEDITNFSVELLDGIFEIAGIAGNYNVNLVACPPSKVDKTNPNSGAIDTMMGLQWAGFPNNNNPLNVRIYNCGHMVKRMTDIPTSHLGEGKATKRQQIDSLGLYGVTDIQFSNSRGIYVIIDDITTTGLSFEACKEFLISHGVPESRIYCLALGKSIAPDVCVVEYAVPINVNAVEVLPF